MKKIYTIILFVSATVFGQNITLDTSYGNNGYTTFDSRTTDHSTYSALLNDGGLLLSSSRYNTTTRAEESIVVKYDSEGNIDTSFANNGVYIVNNHQDDNGIEVFVQSDGKIYLFANIIDSKLFRLNSDGTLDTTFGTNGELKLDDITNFFSPDEAVMLTDGFIVGSTINNGDKDISKLRKYNFEGNRITQFGTNGESIVPATRIMINFNDTSFLVGQETETSPAKLTKINSDGRIDTSFANNGELNIPFTGKIVEFFNGKKINNEYYLTYLLTDSADITSSYILKYDINGNLIPDFGENGKIVIPNTILIDIDQYDNNLYFSGFKIPNYNTVIHSYNYEGIANEKFANNSTFIGNNKELALTLYPRNNSFLVIGNRINSQTDVKHFSAKYNLSNPTASNENIESLGVSFVNPVKDILVINSTRLNVNALEIYSLEGKMILTSKTNIIKTNTLTQGTYILKIHLENGKVVSEKIIKN